MTSTPAARICGPPMPKRATSIRFRSAMARRAAYISPDASPAEIKSGIGGMRGRCGRSIRCGLRSRERAARLVCETAGRVAGIFREAEFLFLVLELIEAVVNAALREQFLVGALFAEAAFVKNEDTRCVLNGAQAMSDHQRGAPGKETVESFANLQLGFGVNAGSCFIKDEEARIVRKSAREANELALADGERRTALVDGGVHPLGQCADKFAESNFVNGVFYGRAVDAR